MKGVQCHCLFYDTFSVM